MKPARAWQRMLSGRRLNLLEPSAIDIEIEDIAHGLSRIARWNGQTVGDYPFSVAAHSLLVERIVSELHPQAPVSWKLAALLHDGPEYVIGDLISPFKSAVGGVYKEMEHHLQAAIHMRFRLPARLPEACQDTIKRADQTAAFIEAILLAGFSEEEARPIWGTVPARLHPRGRGFSAKFKDILGANNCTPLPPDHIEKKFLQRFKELAH